MTDKEVMLGVLNELISIRKNCSSLLNKIEEQRETLETAITQPDVFKTYFGKTEPVAWMYDWTTSDGEFIQDWTTSEAETLRDTKPNIISNIRPLYTAQREWVGLTKADVYSWELPEGATVFEFVQFVEAKLKEKNT